MIQIKDNVYSLQTRNTSYCFRVVETGHIEHLYYGSRIEDINAFAIGNKKITDGDNQIPAEGMPKISLEDFCLEFSSYGKGDIRDPFVEITHADGSFTSDFRFKYAEVTKGKKSFNTLPGSYGDESEVETLCLTCKDIGYGLTLKINYYVYEACDVITRSAVVINESDESVTIDRLMSMQLDVIGCDYCITSFHGNWAREMDKHTIPVTAGKFVNSSYTGNTSSRSNPFIIISKDSITEETGDCIGINLVYSGNHYEVVEADSHDHTRILSGINPQNFAWKLEPGAEFEAPEAVMTFSAGGFSKMSHNMHEFVRKHIIRGEWQYKERPILLNSWEAAYFDINEEKLLKLAKAGADAGMELFVMDDGWFGERDDDTTSLGDWDVNLKKLPGGLSSLADKVNALGMDFGIWIEPEMISVKSKLYEAHPDWDMSIPGKAHVEMRAQRILDLANPEIVDYISDKISQMLSSANISYVKWDMNRNMTDVYSKYLPAERQKETAHRYVLGFYEIAKRLNERFPHILFEGCSSGGNRFDLGMLAYFPQIWASDDTDAMRRLDIQNGYSYGYPTSAPTTHVSACPNHQTMRRVPLDTRFNVALLGNLGYEVNLCNMKQGELEQIKYQVEFYKKYRKFLQYGTFYRDIKDNLYQWTTVSEDKKYAFCVVTQVLTKPNPYMLTIKIPGLEENATYKVSAAPEFYDLLDLDDEIMGKVDENHPIRNIYDKAVEISDNDEEYVLSGLALAKGGIMLKRTISENVWSDPVSHFPDFASKLFIVEKI